MPESRRPDDGRDALVGTVAHRLLFGLLTPGATPADLSELPFTEALARADRLLAATDTSSVERRALRQRTAGAALTYLRMLLPPDTWRVWAVDVAVAGGRIDVVWYAGATLLVDEVKTGPRAGALRSTQEQVTRYLRAIDKDTCASVARTLPRAAQTRVMGGRLLVTSRPEQSWFQPLEGRRTTLSSTPFIRDRCRPPPP